MHEVSEACCDVFLILCRELEVILHRRCDVRRIWALTPRMHRCWRAAWPYAVVCKRMGYRWAGIWLSGIPSSSLASLDFLLPHFRLTLEFPPDQIRFSQNRRIFFVETPLNCIAFQQEVFSACRIYVDTLPLSCFLSLLCCMALVTPHLFVFADMGPDRCIR